MSVAEWPGTLPHECLADAWGAVPYRAPVETEMEGGNVRLRGRPGDNLATVTVALRFSPEQVAIWSAFLQNDLARGAARFVMPVSLDGSSYERRLVQIQRGGAGVRHDPIGRGLHTRVGFTLWVFPAAMTPPEA